MAVMISRTGVLPTPGMLSASWNLMAMATEGPLESIGQVGHRWYSNAKRWSWPVDWDNQGLKRPENDQNRYHLQDEDEPVHLECFSRNCEGRMLAGLVSICSLCKSFAVQISIAIFIALS